ncbi:right-handed parallel beta-helix repeat-containing protein [Coraliomargarita sp. SDUM461003]|uniref:Right-handed parallel beta-helix repeat-containing protein n=1 Tax=Thalassobacterium maritimum TaxID=3041265 RepID=A0ABU1ATA5_9BACT|nr:right-handed parallel beta-helix repeat-containing protein [Coraliomargarita sp. SDUM461003]MDQ8206375.1 right-handed parallel beta-helix repeat-containing protein [Coraliomargarita sp. SDUM461003]
MKQYFIQFLLITLFCSCRANTIERSTSAASIPDLQAWITQAIENGETRIKVPKGVYRLTPVNFSHLELNGVKDVEIDFQGSELVCTERTRALDFANCERLTIKNVSIDYDPKLYAQGRITEYTPEYFQMEVFEGYPIDDLSTKSAEVYGADTHELKPGFRTFHDIKRIEKLGGRTVRIHRKKHMDGVDDFVEVGDILLVKTKRERMDGGRFAPHAVVSSKCRDMRFENVTVYASNCFSFLGDESSNTQYYRCRVDRKKDDPTVGYPRMRSSNWDAYHSINAEVGPTIEECYAGYMGDDGVNIRGDYHIVAEGEGSALTVLAKHALNIRPGDPVEVVARNGELIAVATALSVARKPDYPQDKIDAAKSKFTLILPGNVRTAWTVTLDKAVAIDDISVICATNRVGRGFRVINNVIGHNRSRGILTKASDGVISGNLIEDTGLESLKLSPNISNWLEAAYYQNLVVRDNIIRNGKFGAHFGQHRAAQILIGGCRSGLVFEDNTVEYSGDIAAIVSDLDGGVFQGNEFKHLEGDSNDRDPILFERTENIQRR